MYLPKIVNGSWLITCLPARQVHRIRKGTTNYELRTTNRKSKGFTLIELLVVISIIAILMAVATVSYLNAQQKGRDNKRKTDLKAVQQALEIYFNQNGKYPETDTGGLIRCPSASGFAWGSGVFTCGSPSKTYMSPLPKDPIFTTATTPATPYYYWSENTTAPINQTYKLFAKIENTKDRDLIDADNITECKSNTPGAAWATSGIYFCVINP